MLAGLAGGAVLASTGGTTDLNMGAVALTVLTAPLLTAAYVATLLRIFQTRAGRRLAAALAPAGRMALTNYLAQSLICALIFTGWGFGLVGHAAPLTGVLVAIAIFLAQLLISAAWLNRHRYGPVEWLLRAVTNLTRPALAPRPGRGDWRARRRARVIDGCPNHTTPARWVELCGAPPTGPMLIDGTGAWRASGGPGPPAPCRRGRRLRRPADANAA